VRWIAVDGKVLGGNPATGHLRLTINIPHDAIANAVPLVAGTSQTSTNAGATHEYGEPKHCGGTYATKSVWYRSTASSSSTVTVGATGSNVLCVAVYQAAAAPSSVSSLAAIAAASDDQGDPAEVTFAAPAGATYLVAVDGVSYETACSQTTRQCNYATTSSIFTITLQD
jgi:hypothetical protein